MSIILFIVILGIIVFVHEYGHFLLARKNGIVVEEFAIGMGPLIYGKKKGDTLYSIRLLPIGGFCKMLGAEEESNEEGSFNNAHVFGRIAVIAAGSIFNIILSFVLVFILLSFNGFNSLAVSSVSDGSPAYHAGLQQGDVIRSIDGRRMLVFANASMAISQSQGVPLDVLVNRNGERVLMSITPQPHQLPNGATTYIIGFTSTPFVGMLNRQPSEVQSANLFNTIQHSYYLVLHFIRSVATGLIELFTFNVALDDIAGPVGLVTIIGDAYESAIEYSPWVVASNMMMLAALISANLALFNLLPIPALDGGRLIFLFIEAIRGRPISPEREGLIHMFGFVLLIGLIIVVSFNDIFRLFR